MQEPNSAKPETPTDVMVENIITQETEINHQSVDHNTLPSHTITAPQYNSLLVIEATQSAPSNLTIMKMRPDATDLVSSQDSLSQSNYFALMSPHSQAKAKVSGSLHPLSIPL
ncbi:hypothetical protein DSO57_1007880 [Entomophthora muscae]|uniref:Uncharacterized protein n=1 Tax=Entomophthora muscae TaxID=34485 RepID=A0ACC2SJY3_9FUNG|nr:hypothetical protein DSO57_1007880 [Entomophthora muscae]